MPPRDTEPQQDHLFEVEKGSGRLTHIHGERAVQVGTTVVTETEFRAQLEETRIERGNHHAP